MSASRHRCWAGWILWRSIPTQSRRTQWTRSSVGIRRRRPPRAGLAVRLPGTGGDGGVNHYCRCDHDVNAVADPEHHPGPAAPDAHHDGDTDDEKPGAGIG
jgi:hypothetical protein